ncbi:sodium:solute symporter [Zunongwangia sp. H14]|uniref:sodium:solute symporter family protein n=1 Tax=Zunongwangia sp. H14 TaxID=3240792 RepID=UPI003564744E
MMNLSLAFIIGYIIFLILVSYWVWIREKKDPLMFALAGRKIGWFGVFASTFTLIGAGELMSVATLAFVNDGAAITLLGGYGIGMMVLGMFAKKFNSKSGNHFYFSLPDLIYEKYGHLAGLLSNGLTIFAFFALLVLQLFAGSVLLNELTSIPIWINAFLFAFVIAGYLMIAGFGGVIITDKIQLLLMLTGLPLLIFHFFPSTDGLELLFELDYSPLGTISILLTGIFVVIGSGDIWQRIYAARSDGAVRTGMFAAGFGFIGYTIMIALIGIEAREYGYTEIADNAFLSTILAQEPGILISIVVLAVFSAILSTADTEVYLISTLLANEKRRWKKNNVNLSSELTPKEVRYFIPTIAITGALISIYSKSLVSIYEFLLLLLLALSPIIVLAKFKILNPLHSSMILFLGIASLIFIWLAPFMSLDFAFLVVIPGGVYGLFLKNK